jgi:hypothetical protein
LLKKYFKYHGRVSKPQSAFDEQFAEIEEYLFRKCSERQINWRTLSWDDKVRLATEFGCKRSYIDAMYAKNWAM